MKRRRYCKNCQGEVDVTHVGPCPHCNLLSGFLLLDDREPKVSTQEWEEDFSIADAQPQPREVLRTVGRCIYCFTMKGSLGHEHVIPWGLGGRWELKEASCRSCEDTTKRFEQHLLRDILIGPRAALGLPTRRRAQRPPTYPFTYVRDGQAETVALAAEEYPALAVFPIFALPACQDTRPYSKGIDVADATLVQLGGPNLKATLQRYGAKTVRYSVRHEFPFYPRCILKIAYGFAVGRFGLDRISEAYVLPAIRGERDDAGMWLGCDGVQKLPGVALHEYSVEDFNGQIIVRVKLFSRAKNIPEYVVVVGKSQ